MAKKKFPTAEKIRAVELHIRDGMGYGGISDRYGVPTAALRLWIRNYQTFGVEGLMRRKGNQSYSSELKKCAVEEYLSRTGSQADIGGILTNEKRNMWGFGDSVTGEKHNLWATEIKMRCKV